MNLIEYMTLESEKRKKPYREYKKERLIDLLMTEQDRNSVLLKEIEEIKIRAFDLIVLNKK